MLLWSLISPLLICSVLCFCSVWGWGTRRFTHSQIEIMNVDKRKGLARGSETGDLLLWILLHLSIPQRFKLTLRRGGEGPGGPCCCPVSLVLLFSWAVISAHGWGASKAYIFGVILDAMVQYEYTSNVAGCKLHWEEDGGGYLARPHRRIVWLVQEGVCFWPSSLPPLCFSLFLTSFSRLRSTNLQGSNLRQSEHIRTLEQILFSEVFLAFTEKCKSPTALQTTELSVGLLNSSHTKSQRKAQNFIQWNTSTWNGL